MNKKFVCESCGEECTMELQAIAKNGDRICYGCEDEYYAKCSCCDELFPKKELKIDVNDNWVCDECSHSDEYFVCEYCEEITPISDESCYNGICDYCSDRYTECEECGEVLLKEDMVYINNNYYCSDCYNDLYSVCDCCGTSVLNDDIIWHNGNEYCCHCYDEEVEQLNDLLEDYNYKPPIQFYGNDKMRHYGMELETVKGTVEIFNSLNEIYEIHMCSDGSLCDNGIEIVTQPCTVDYMNTLIDDIIDKGKGLESSSTQGCGIHIHITRADFGTSKVEQDINILKLIYLFDKHKDFFKKFSRRKSYGYCMFNDVNIDFEKDSLVELFGKSYNNDRYRVVNNKNEHTVEIRLFGGSFDAIEIKACVQLVDLLMTMILSLNVDEVKYITLENIYQIATDELGRYLDTIVKYDESRKLICV